MNFKVSLCWNLNFFDSFTHCQFIFTIHNLFLFPLNPLLSYPTSWLSFKVSYFILSYILLFYLKSSYFILSYSILSSIWLLSYFILSYSILFYLTLSNSLLSHLNFSYLILFSSILCYRISPSVWCIRFSIPETSGLRGKSSNPSWSRLWQKKTSTINNP